MMTSMITWSADMTSCATSYEKTPAPSAQYKLVVDVYIISTLCVVGFVGNALSICILRSSRHERSGTTTFLLQTLAVVDTAYLLTCLFIQPIKVQVQSVYQSIAIIYTYFYKVVQRHFLGLAGR